jgi:hypothetical protein
MTAADLFDHPLKVINIGLTSFAQDLKKLGVECEQVSVENEGDTQDIQADKTELGE